MKYSKELAEICGIHAGDGYLRDDGKRREWDISGSIEEKGYYDNHVIPLFNKIFNLKLKGRYFSHRNTYGFVIRDKKIVKFALNILKFPNGNKLKIRIPSFIFEDKSFIASFLRGYFDTDGCLNFDKKHKIKHYYPRIMFTTVSRRLVRDFRYLIGLIDLKFSIWFYNSKIPNEKRQYRTQIVGLKWLDRWMNQIGIKNPSKLSRYLIWKKFGFCPPNTTYKQRKSILNGKLDPNIIYGPVAQPG